jgi:formyl-CoA transferase
VVHREELIQILQSVFEVKSAVHWLSVLKVASIPSSPINTIDKVFSMQQVSAREMLIHMTHPMAGDLALVASPLKMSETPVQYLLPPPLKGEHTAKVLTELLGFSPLQVDELKARGVI